MTLLGHSECSPVTRHPSPVTRHPSPVTRHPAPGTRHPPLRHLTPDGQHLWAIHDARKVSGQMAAARRKSL
ncbi:hypothetical protein DY969_26015 [Pseudomonas aeruginosa]|nr:hypothetical protein DY969_26015 [Pseudomonas aeruginosa]